MHARKLLAWIAVGLVGLALAAGVTYAATQLSSQRIGLSAEPPSAGEELAPRTTATTPPRTSGTTGHRGDSTSVGPAGDSHGNARDPVEERRAHSHSGGSRNPDD